MQINPARIGAMIRLSLSLALGGVALLAAGCSADEFKVPPQQGAWNRGVYPSFNQQPKGETAQFTPEDQAQLTAKLHTDGKRLEASAYAEDKAQAAQPTNSEVQQQADKDIQDTLRQIQNGGK